MERKQTRLTRKTYYARKIKEAVHLLFYQHHRKPGVKGWELRRRLGADYPNVLSVLDNHLEKLDLQVKTIFEEGRVVEKPSLRQLDKARFYITLRGGLEAEEAKLIGWRIDDIAGLATAISFIISKKGKAPRKEVEDLLRIKLPNWRVDVNMERYIRSGYLAEDESGHLYLDWRTRAEIDQKALVELLLTTDLKHS
jgi:hypothetical protein